VFVGLILVLVVGFVLYVQLTGIPSYPVRKIELKVDVTPERVAHGRKIASMLCAECHLDPKTGRLTGRRMPDLPPQFGVAYSLNITQDRTNGVGAWTDGEIAYLLRTGVARDGRYTPPWMVKLPGASDEEIASIIAFLRSNDPLVQAVPVDDRPSEPSLLTKFLTHVAFKPFPYPDAPIVAPPITDRVAYGRHLALDVLACFACHSADFATNDELTPERSKGFFAGGNTMIDANAQPIRTSNITFDAESGIGSWTEDQFVRAVKEGFRPDRRPLLYPMQAYVELDDAEVRAIYAYLATVPKVHNVVPRATPATPPGAASEGKKVYYKYACQSCHGETGAGLCDLRTNRRKYPADADLVAFIKHPSVAVPGSKMPAWEGVIDEADYAPLVEYLRTLAAAPAS
jgi:cytochrome c2